MIIFVSLSIIIVGLNSLLKSMSIKNNKKIYCVIVCLCMLLITGLRREDFGMYDTINYIIEFKSIIINNYSFAYIINNFKDPVFYCFVKLFSMFCQNEHVFVFVFSSPSIIAISWFIYKHSRNSMISFLIYMNLIYYGTFYLMRHMIALTFIVIAFHYLLVNKIKPYILFVAIASCFHASACIFFIALLFKKLKIGVKQLLVILIMFLIFNLFDDLVLDLLQKYVFSYERFRDFSLSLVRSGEMGQKITLFYICMCMLALSFFYIFQNKNKSNEKIAVMFNTASIATVLAIAVNVVGEFSRLSQFFSITFLILVPDALNFEKNKKLRIILNFIMIIMFLVYFLFFLIKAYLPYNFFWEV